MHVLFNFIFKCLFCWIHIIYQRILLIFFVVNRIWINRLIISCLFFFCCFLSYHLFYFFRCFSLMHVFNDSLILSSIFIPGDFFILRHLIIFQVFILTRFSIITFTLKLITFIRNLWIWLIWLMFHFLIWFFLFMLSHLNVFFYFYIIFLWFNSIRSTRLFCWGYCDHWAPNIFWSRFGFNLLSKSSRW